MASCILPKSRKNGWRTADDFGEVGEPGAVLLASCQLFYALDPDEQDEVVADGSKAGSFAFSVLVDLDTDESRETVASIAENLEPSAADRKH